MRLKKRRPFRSPRADCSHFSAPAAAPFPPLPPPLRSATAAAAFPPLPPPLRSATAAAAPAPLLLPALLLLPPSLLGEEGACSSQSSMTLWVWGERTKSGGAGEKRSA